MPPKLTPERIQEKLAELRACVTDHVDVLRTRSGFMVLQKLRQTASKEEKAWPNFLTRTTSAFTAAHLQHLACTYDLINEASAFHQACTPSEGADGPDLPSQVVMAIRNSRSAPRVCGAARLHTVRATHHRWYPHVEITERRLVSLASPNEWCGRHLGTMAR